MAKVQIMETVLRDAGQSLIATRMPIEEMLPIVDTMDKVGYAAVECWGGATFDSCLRFLHEDPWERLRVLKSHFKKTPTQMLLRGQNILGYSHYADDVVDRFVKKSVDNGIDRIRIFDCLNDLRNLETAVKATKEAGAHAQIALVYTLGDAYTLEYWEEIAGKIEELGADSICIKDMSGLLRPQQAYELVTALKKGSKLPIDLHTHYTSGQASMTYWKAAEAGVDIIDCATTPFALGTSQPSTDVMVEAFRGTPYDTGLDQNLLKEISDYFTPYREECIENGLLSTKVLGVNTRTMLYQVPGGMLSNMIKQLADQGKSDKLTDVLEEVPKVRKDLGEPPLVTPSSQIVGTQAVMNVLMGERYKICSGQTKDLVSGKYGQTIKPMDPEVVKKVIGDTERITCRPADLIEPAMDKFTEEAKAHGAESEEDVLSYASFPQVAAEFFKWREDERNGLHVAPAEEPAPAPAAAPAPAVSAPVSGKALKDFTLTVNGAAYSISVQENSGAAAPVARAAAPAPAPAAPAPAPAPAAPAPAASGAAGGVQITAGAAGKVFKIEKKVGDAVSRGDAVIVIEAMKMEIPMVAPEDGVVASIDCTVGDAVEAGTVLATLN